MINRAICSWHLLSNERYYMGPNNRVVEALTSMVDHAWLESKQWLSNRVRLWCQFMNLWETMVNHGSVVEPIVDHDHSWTMFFLFLSLLQFRVPLKVLQQEVQHMQWLQNTLKGTTTCSTWATLSFITVFEFTDVASIIKHVLYTISII